MLLLFVIVVSTQAVLKMNSMLLSVNENLAAESQSAHEEKVNKKKDLTEKLQQFVKTNNNAKDKWLLSSHVHCFIGLS